MTDGVRRPWAALTLAAAIACGPGGGDARTETGAETGAVDSLALDSAAAAPVEFGVASVMIGRQIGDNDFITEPTFQFAPSDTVYVSVATAGEADSAAVLGAKWEAQGGKLIDSSSTSVEAGEPRNTAFQASQPKGWAEGTYRVTILLNGDSVEARTFAVRK